MGYAVDITVPLLLTGKVVAISRRVLSGEIVAVQSAQNTLAQAFKVAVAKDMVHQLGLSSPRAMAFSRDVVTDSPFPAALTNEFRASISTFADANKFQIVSVLGSSEGNSGGGNIRSIGFYFGTDTTNSPGTGTLGSLVNTLNVAKDSSLEVTFQYEITVG
jgi:hypothetical protein